MLWNYDRRVIAVLGFFILGTIGKLSLQGETKEAFLMSHGPPAAAGSDLGLSLHPLLSNPSDRSSQAGSSAILSGTRSLILVLPALATNFLSALLIGIQAWCVPPTGLCVVPRMLKMEWLYAIYRRRRRTLIDYLNEKSTAIKAEKIFALVVESGFAYCCVWVRSF